MSEIDETQVAITKHKKKLEAIRERPIVNDTRDENDRRYSEAASRSVQTAQGTGQGDAGQLQGTHSADGRREERMESGTGITGRDGEGIRSVDATSQSATQSADSNHRAPGASKLDPELTPEQKASRDRELHRQAQERYRDRQKEANLSSETITSHHFSGDATSATATATSDAKFGFKSPFKFGSKEPEKVKLLTKTEAEDSEEAIVRVLMFGTSLIDDALEIIVRDHEPVQIWEMDENDATLFAQAHLKRAQKDQDAARVARRLVQLHDKLMTFQYIFSRTKATVTHVKNHRGFSFR